jgi:hypothetical protein
MGLIADKHRATTVGELREILARYPANLPLRIESDDTAVIYRVTPERGDTTMDPRGFVRITSAEFD